jgi:hypothetical protein
MINRTSRNGTKYWYNDNYETHREDGPAIIWANGNQQYYQHDQLHRTDGPAEVFWDGDCSYYQYGKLHRIDGPAIDWGLLSEWWIDGVQIDCKDNEEFLRIVKMKILL